MLIQGIENSVLIIILLFGVLVLYLLYFVLDFITKKRPVVQNSLLNENEEVQEEEVECSICLNSVISKINKTQFLCNHSFCCDCVINYINQKKPNNISCPLCRRTVNIILMSFEQNESNKEKFNKIIEYNYKNINGVNYYVRIF